MEHNIWDGKSWTGTIVTIVLSAFSNSGSWLRTMLKIPMPTTTDLQYAAAWLAVLSGIVTTGYTIHKWYKSIKEKK
jgi:hypothetical protein